MYFKCVRWLKSERAQFFLAVEYFAEADFEGLYLHQHQSELYNLITQIMYLYQFEPLTDIFIQWSQPLTSLIHHPAGNTENGKFNVF